MCPREQVFHEANSESVEAKEVDWLDDKLYFRIGEVARMVGVPPYVLRYWEGEFRGVRPQKSRSRQRIYRRQDIETLLKIKYLLYEQKYKIAGAREQLRARAKTIATAALSPVYVLERSAQKVRSELSELRLLLQQSETSRPFRDADPAAYVAAKGGSVAIFNELHSEEKTRRVAYRRPRKMKPT